MAIQTGMITLSGKLGNQVFYEKDGKPFVKGAADPETYQLSEGSKKTSVEFGNASVAASLIKKAFLPITKQVGDNKLIHRLKRKMIAVINTGPETLMGTRQPVDGDIALLKNFEFNSHCHLNRLIRFSPMIEIEPDNELRIRLPKLVIKDAFSIQPNTSMLVIQFMCASFDFTAKNGRYTRPEDLLLPVDKKSFPGGVLKLPLEDTENKILMVAMGISFVSRSGLPARNREWYAGNIVEAVYIKDGKIVSFQYPEKAVKPADENQPTNRIAWILDEEEEQQKDTN